MTSDFELLQALAEGRDKLSERLDEITDARDFWRGGCLIMAVLAALEIVRQWSGWTL